MEYEPDDIYGFKGGTDEIFTPKGILKTEEWNNAADGEERSKLAGEYLSELRQRYLDELPNDKAKAIDLWKRDAEFIWDNASPSFGERAGEVVKGAARSLVYGTAATGLAALHGGLSIGNRLLSAPALAAEELSGRDIGARRAFEAYQRDIDELIPEGKVFDEKAGQLIRWAKRGKDERQISALEFSNAKSNSKTYRNGKYYRDFAADHEDDFNAFLDSVDAYAADNSRENYDAMKAAERQAFASAAAFNKDDAKGYENRSFTVNENTRNLIKLYAQTRDPQVRSALTAVYGVGVADARARDAIEAVQKRILDRWGDNVLGREMATFVEYADPSEAVATALTAVVGKLAHSAVAGLKAAKGVAGGVKAASSVAEKMKAAGKIAGGIGGEMAGEALTEYWQTGIENPFASEEEKREAAAMAAAQAALMGGAGAAIGGGLAMRNRAFARRAEALSDVANKAEETAGGEAATGRGVSVPDGVPNGGVFLGGNGGFYRNVDGVPAPISDAEAAKILNQINQSGDAANGGLSGQLNGQGDNLNDNLNGLGGKLSGLDDKSEELAGGGKPDIVGVGELDDVAPAQNEVADEVDETAAEDKAAVFDDSQVAENIEQGAEADNQEVGGGVSDDVAEGVKPTGEMPKGGKLRSFEKRDFKGVETDGFVPAAQASVEKRIADDAANAAKWVAMTPEERIAECCPDFVDKAIELSRAQARKNAGHPLPTYGGLKLELVALKSGKFKIIEDGKKLKPIKVFRDEAQAREFLGKWILAYADASKITYYVPADVRGVFADAGGLSAENAYVRDAKGEIKVDGIVMRRAKPERLVRDVFVENWDREYDSVKDEKAELERLSGRDFDSMDEFKRWLEKNSWEVSDNFDEIEKEYGDEPAVDGKYDGKELARRQQLWLDNNVDDLARLYGVRIVGNGESEVKAMKSPLERFRKFTVDFKNGVDAFFQKRLPTNKALSFQLEEGTLGKYGIPDLPVVMLYSTLSKVANKHKIPAEIIKSLPDELKNAVAVFSYPKEANSFDLLIEPTMPDGRPIVVSLRKSDKIFDVEFKINEATTVHPKEHINRLAHWAQSGRLVYWDNERGRKYLQFRIPANWGRLEEIFSTSLNTQSENVSESQEKISENNFKASFGAKNKASSGGNAGGGLSSESMAAEYGKLREIREKTVGEKPLTFVRPVSAMRSALPKSVRFNKADNRLEGVPSIGDIRRYMARVFNIPIEKGLRSEVRQRGVLGIYYDRLEAIRTLRGHHNDLDTVTHELGHYLETLFFGGKLGSDEVKNFALAAELEGYCVERFGEDAYSENERVGEGWAQFVSDVIKGDRTVAARCPRAFSALNSALRESPRVNEAFGFIRQMAELNANASPLQRVNANIRRRSDGVRKTAVDRLVESGRWFTRMWFDEYEGLERFQKDLERSGVSDEEGSRVIDLARNYAGGSVGQVNYSLTVNQIDLDGRIVGKSLRSILRDNLKTAYDKDNIDAYLMCRRVVEYYKTEEHRGEKNGCRGKFGIEYSDAVDVVSTATDGMRKCAEELDGYIRNDLKLLLDGGLINERIYATCLANKGYSPLQRYMEAVGDADSGGSGGGFANVAPALRAFRGSDREVISSLDSIAKNSRSFREMALKNRVASRVVGGINRGVGLGNWASPAPDRTQAVKLRTREYAEAILAYKEKAGDEAPSSGHVRERKIEALERELKNDPVLACTIFRDEAKSDKANQIITVWNKGEKVAWQIHDRGLYEALAGMDNTASWFWETWLGQLLGGSARVLRAGATSAFQFTAGNLARDIQAATVFSNNGYVPIASALRHGLIPAAIGSAKRVGEAFGRDTSKWFKDSFLAENAKLYDEWVAGGGAMATFAENGIQTAEEVSVDEMLARRSLAADWFDKFKRAPIKRTAELLATPFEGVSKFSEEVNRLAEFGLSRKNAIRRLRKERGLTAAQAREVWDGAEGATMRRKAANDSKEITLNFSRGGRYGKQVNMVVPFFNAGMQGIFKYATDLNPVDWVRLCVALREANVSEMAASVKKNNAVKLAKVVAISSIAAALKAALYNALDDDDKRRLDNLPDWRKRTYWVFCIGGVMYQIPKAQELTPFCAVFDKAAVAAYGIEQDAEGDVLPTSWDILSPSIVPQFVKPFIELYTNRNLFTGAELIPQTIRQNRLPSAQELPSTSSTAKWISRLLAERGVEVSPIHLDWGVNTLFSSLGRWVVNNVANRLAESVGGVPSSPEGMRGWATLTGLDKFIVPEYSASRYVQKFYEGKTEWAQIKGTVRKIQEKKLPARTFTDAQIRRAEWYEGRRDGVAMSREREINLVVKAISEINAAISEAKNSTELTPRQKRAAILDNKAKIDSLAESAYKELIYSEEKYKKWKN